ncbi:MAG: hypothetical protein ACI9O3_001588, partial [Colwellia sp.]
SCVDVWVQRSYTIKPEYFGDISDIEIFRLKVIYKGDYLTSSPAACLSA